MLARVRTAAIYLLRGEHRDELEQLVRVRGWKLVDTYVDNGRRRDQRPELRSMMAAARRRSFDVLVVHRCSVIARSLHELVHTFAKLQRARVQLVSQTEFFESMTFEQVVQSFIAFERHVISDRTREGLRAARRRGRALGRPRVGIDDTVLAMRSSGYSIRAIAAELGVGQGTVQRVLERSGAYRKGSPHKAAQPAVTS